jgi:membrane-associated protease RseP (regulator of RpoE activity)
MGGQKAVKVADLTPWVSLFAEYRLTALAYDNVVEGTLLPHLDAASPDVEAALASWPAPAYLHAKDGRTQVVLVYPVREPPRRWPWMHAALFLATLLTTLAAGALLAGRDPFGTEALRLGELLIPYPSEMRWSVLLLGAPFALPFLGVLLAHEMGHYVAARAHRVRVTLPYFIPFPPYFSIIGTVGAFIRLLGPSVRRATLFDIGSAGPIAGFVASLPLLAFGLAHSDVVPGSPTMTSPFAIVFAGQTVWLGNGTLTYVLASLLVPGRLGEGLVLLHPFAFAGWLGLFVTALNLLPFGQLDGGHVVYALSPRRQAPAARAFVAALFPLGFVWWGWWAWALIILMVNRGRVGHPAVLQVEPPIGRGRRALGWLLIVLFFLTFVPVPIRL